MHIKKAKYTLPCLEPLHVPQGSEIILDQGLTVDANVVKDTLYKISTQRQATQEKEGIPDNDLFFDLEAEINKHPDSLFVKCFAIKANEMNDNGDYFPYDELKLATPTFVGVPVFTNHQNTDVGQSRGKVVHSWWDEDRQGIMIIARVDAEAYPQLARGIKEEHIAATSMGAQVKYSLCSICHNVAETPNQYCGCIQERKTRHMSVAKQQCHYHDHGNLDECPICKCKKGESKTYKIANQQVYEINYGIKFIENSFVVNPACHDCGVTEIIDTSKFFAKVAEIEKTLPRLLKTATETPIVCTDQSCVRLVDDDRYKIINDALAFLGKGAKYIEKIAGQEQLNDLNQALNLLTSVSQDMLTQKDQIDLEFLSDLVKVLADLQAVTDELAEQGYGRLPSPGQEGNATQPEYAPINQNMGQNSAEQPAATGGASKIHTGPAGAAGTVTSPMANKKRINLEKLSKELLIKNKQIKSFLITDKLLKTANHKKTLQIPFSLRKT